MKIMLPVLTNPFELKESVANIIVIENPHYYFEVVSSIQNQINKNDGIVVFSDNDKVVDMSKCVELLTQFVPFEVNKKSLISKLINKLKTIAVDEYTLETNEIKANIQQYVYLISDSTNLNVEVDDFDSGDIFKMSGIKFDTFAETLYEAIIEYMDVVVNLEGDKVFVVCGLRSYIDKNELFEMINLIIGKKLRVLFIEPFERGFDGDCNRIVIDEDLCVI